ncbi:hypothetical protein ACFOD4_04660 [Pseudoroseomonas globiformis]|uniref:Uncharacterized protein n=1 Tax=Teichococcus globiformis TaxID=2307229 RepID=A0ABV7FY79_9PROT
MESEQSGESDVGAFISRYTDKVISRFAEQRYDRLIRKAIHAMQRVPAAAFTDDREHRSLWDDYCHLQQNAPDRGPSRLAWEVTVGTILDGIVAAIPVEDAALLSLPALWNLDDDDLLSETGIRIMPNAIREVLEARLLDRAKSRDISRSTPVLFR